MKNAIFGAVIAVSVTVFNGALSPAWSQDAQTLADIRQEAAVLSVELLKLRRELSTTGAPNTGFSGSSMLERADTMEASLARLTGRMEQLEFRIDNIVKDGTLQLEDMNFRLCELEEGCDIGNLPSLKPIGGSAGTSAPAAAPVVAAAPSPQGGDELAEAEQFDFDAAKAAFDGGNYEIAATAFDEFTQNYTGGFLTSEAHFMRGESLSKLGLTSDAARAYLASFNESTEGSRAPSALLRLGTSMVALGHLDKGCVMLNEVGARFSGSAEAGQASEARSRLGCQ